MDNQEEDNALNIDYLMEYIDIDSENEFSLEPIPLYFIRDSTIQFGFFEQSTKSFYSIEKISNVNFRIKQATQVIFPLW